MTPKLEVVVFTYNHEAFVERTLSSVLAQRTDFEIGIRIHDDVSADGTLAVIRRTMENAHVPWEVVQPSANRFADGTSFYHEFIASSTAEYVAILDGDDCWIDEDKLQTQVDLLDRNPRAALCHHSVLELVGDDMRSVDWPPPEFRMEVVPGSRLSVYNVVSSSSVVVRMSMFPREMPAGYNELGIGDYPMWALASAGNDIAYVDRPMTAYRVHQANIYASLDRERRVDRELEARIYITAHVPHEYKKIWRDGIVSAIGYHLDESRPLAPQAELRARDEELAAAREELREMRNSSSWRITAPLRKLRGRSTR